MSGFSIIKRPLHSLTSCCVVLVSGWPSNHSGAERSVQGDSSRRGCEMKPSADATDLEGPQDRASLKKANSCSSRSTAICPASWWCRTQRFTRGRHSLQITLTCCATFHKPNLPLTGDAARLRDKFACHDWERRMVVARAVMFPEPCFVSCPAHLQCIQGSATPRTVV